MCQAQEAASPEPSIWHPFSSKEQIEVFLRTAEIIKSKSLGEGVTNPQKLYLDDGQIQHNAVFKVIDERKMGVTKLAGTAEYDFKDSWMFEIAAYELDKLIGLDMVPPTVERTYKGKKGSVQWWVPNAMTEGDRVKKNLSPSDPLSWSRQIVRMRIFDILIYNIDRNLGNIIITPDWRIWLIDHSRTFKSIDILKTEKQMTFFPKSLMENLRKLDEAALTANCGNYLRPPEIKTLLKRRDMILQYYEKLLAQSGQDITFP